MTKHPSNCLLHTKTPPSCCVSSQLDYEQSLELFSWSVDFNARKRETACNLAYNWRQAQFSALKGYMYIMGEKQIGHFSSSKTVIYHFHINGFTPSPTLKQRLMATRKWPKLLFYFLEKNLGCHDQSNVSYIMRFKSLHLIQLCLIHYGPVFHKVQLPH